MEKLTEISRKVKFSHVLCSRVILARMSIHKYKSSLHSKRRNVPMNVFYKKRKRKTGRKKHFQLNLQAFLSLYCLCLSKKKKKDCYCCLIKCLRFSSFSFSTSTFVTGSSARVETVVNSNAEKEVSDMKGKIKIWT